MPQTCVRVTLPLCVPTDHGNKRGASGQVWHVESIDQKPA